MIHPDEIFPAEFYQQPTNLSCTKMKKSFLLEIEAQKPDPETPSGCLLTFLHVLTKHTQNINTCGNMTLV